MLIFFSSALVMTLFALALLVPALWRRDTASMDQAADHRHDGPIDQESVNVDIAREQLTSLMGLRDQGELSPAEFDQRKEELELTLASSLVPSPVVADAAVPTSRGRWMAWLVAAFVPLVSTIIYLQIGHPDSLDPAYLERQVAVSEEGEKMPPIEELLPKLEAHLNDNPEDGKGWRLLGVTYLRMQRFSDADAALTKALDLDSDNIDLLLQLADAKAMVAGGQLSGAPEQLVEKALTLNPDDLRGIWLSGMVKQQKGEYAAAVETWQRLLPQLGDQPEALAEVKDLIADAKRSVANSDKPEGEKTAPADVSKTPEIEASVSVSVDLATALAAKVTPEQVLYVYAKAAQGPPMPLAVARLQVKDLPVTVTLDDSMAMMPQMKLSAFTEVIIGARISHSGDPVAQPGDFFGETDAVSVRDSAQVSIRISSTVP